MTEGTENFSEMGESSMDGPPLKKSRRSNGESTIPKVKSEVFEEFTYDPETQKWTCNHCGVIYSHPKNGGSTSLKRHLESAHKNMAFPTKANEGLSSNSKLGGKGCFQAVTKDGFKSHILNFVVGKNLPISLVDSPEMRALIDYCSGGNENCKVPSSTTLRRWIDEKYEAEKQELIQELQNTPGKISYAVDGWTSPNNIAFQGTVASYIDENWQLKTHLLEMAELKGAHTGENMALSFSSTMDTFGTWHKLWGVTGDNAANVDKFAKELESICSQKGLLFKANEHRVRCFAHIVNLACKEFLKGLGDQQKTSTDDAVDDEADELFELPDWSETLEIEEDEEIIDPVSSETVPGIISKLRSGVIAIRASPQRFQVFKNECQRLNLEVKALTRDVSTRWNSTYLMLKRALALKQPYAKTLGLLAELQQYQLSEDDWKKIGKVANALEKFEQVTKWMSKHKTPTISDTAGAYQELFGHLENICNSTKPTLVSIGSSPGPLPSDDPNWFYEAATKAWTKLKKYYPTSDGLVYVLGTVMDPRCKLIYFKNSGWEQFFIDQAEKKITDLWDAEYKGSSIDEDDQPASEDSEGTPDFLSRRMYEKTLMLGAMQSSSDELARYLKEPVVNPSAIPKQTGILGWWKLHEEEYPRLSAMARDVLAVFGSSVPVESAFSIGSCICCPRRRSMKSATINKLMCLRDWLRRKTDSVAVGESYVEAIRQKILDEDDDDEE